MNKGMSPGRGGGGSGGGLGPGGGGGGFVQKIVVTRPTPPPGPPPSPAPSIIQKDFARRVSADEAVKELRSSGDAPASTASIDSPIREVFAFFLVEGLSYELHNAFCRLSDQLDQITGAGIRVRVIGDTELSGTIFLAGLSDEARARLKHDAELYVEEVIQKGRESDHVLREDRKLCEFLGRDTDALPYLDIRASGSGEPLGTLQIKPEWTRAEEARSIICEEILAWFRVKALATWLEERIDADTLRLRLRPALEELTDRIDSAIKKWAPHASSSTGVLVRIRVRPGASWSDVTMRLLSDEQRISVRTGVDTRVLHYIQMGMGDGRNAMPTEQWDLLVAFLKREGLTWADSEADPKNQKRKERLAQQLKTAFGIEDDPFEPIQHGWKPRFRVALPDSD